MYNTILTYKSKVTYFNLHNRVDVPAPREPAPAAKAALPLRIVLLEQTLHGFPTEIGDEKSGEPEYEKADIKP